MYGYQSVGNVSTWTYNAHQDLLRAPRYGLIYLRLRVFFSAPGGNRSEHMISIISRLVCCFLVGIINPHNSITLDKCARDVLDDYYYPTKAVTTCPLGSTSSNGRCHHLLQHGRKLCLEPYRCHNDTGMIVLLPIHASRSSNVLSNVTIG